MKTIETFNLVEITEKEYAEIAGGIEPVIVSLIIGSLTCCMGAFMLGYTIGKVIF